MLRSITMVLVAILIPGFSFAETDVTSERQRLFAEIDDAHDVLENQMDAEQWDELVLTARELADKIDQLPALFPESSHGQGRSRKRIWDNWEDFSARLNDFSQNYTEMEQAVSAQDFDAAERARRSAKATCRSCHMRYRSLW